MIRVVATLLFFLVSGHAVFAATRTTAAGPVTGATTGITANEIELRLPLILSRVLKKITLKNVAATRFIFPNEFSEILKARNIEPKPRFSIEELERLRGPVDGGGILTVELLPSETTATARLNYFDYTTYATTSVVITSEANEMAIALAKQFMQIETRRTALSTINPGSKLLVLTSLEPVAHNNLMLHLMEKGYRLASIPDSVQLTATDMASLREFESNGLSYVFPRRGTEDAAIRLVLSPAADEEEETFVFDSSASGYMRYVEGFPGELALAGAGLSAKTGAEYLLIFSERGKDSFARVLDLKTGNMIWQQDGFPDANSSSLPDIAAALTQSLITPPPAVNSEQFKVVMGANRPGVAGQSGGLASVAIIDFYDRTNSKLFGYLSNSLSQAVDGSMERIFEFQRSDAAKNSAAGAAYLKGAAQADKNALKGFQQQTGADYVIYGDYVYDKKTKKVTIHAQAYDLVRLIAVSNQSLESPVDATLFTAVDQIAERIVQDILQLAQQ